MKVAIIGNPGHVKKTYEKEGKTYKKPVLDIFRQCGQNTGNLAFWYAVNNHITSQKKFFGWNPNQSNDINKNYDVLVFIAANQLNPNTDVGVLADLFEKVNLPLLIIGLGIQAKKIGDKLIFSKGTRRFIDVIKTKAKHISVRGQYTAKVLKDLGVNNVKITGCPSNFINLKKNLGKANNLKLKNIKNIVVNTNLHPGSMKSFLTLVSGWRNNGYKLKFIMQDDNNIIKFCNDKRFDEHINTVKFIKRLILPDNNLYDVYKFASECFETFFNVEVWLEYLHRFDLSIGTRLHGNLLAFQASVPTIFIPYDARVTEMVETMELPRISYQNAIKLRTLENIIKNIEFDPIKYDKKRESLIRTYINILNDYGIKYNNELKDFIS
ncbi:MAG: polysaccharide pyruvyl transferase family protein [Promethearchaeota archaeon]